MDSSDDMLNAGVSETILLMTKINNKTKWFDKAVLAKAFGDALTISNAFCLPFRRIEA